MENNIEYGIQKCTVGDDAVESTFVKFGDGLTRISTVVWSDKLSGIQICRDGNETEPFAVREGEQANKANKIPDLDKVYLVFDNKKSIDVMIERLIDAKSFI